MKVFLGGTTASSSWRDTLIPLLKVDYFNPIVDNWTKEHQEEEIRQRGICEQVLYVITPRMRGFLSICELIDDSNKRPKTTLFCILKFDTNELGTTITFTEEAKMSLDAISKMAITNGAKKFSSLESLANYLNNYDKEL